MTDEARRWLDQGAAAAQAGDRARAEPLLLEAARLDPGNPEVWLWLGWVAATPQEALERIGRAMSLAPQDPRAQKAYAWAQGRLPQPAMPPAPAPPPPVPPSPAPSGTPEEMTLDPQAAYEQGCSLLDRDAPDQAIPFLEAAVDGNPVNADYHAQLGAAYYRTGRTDDAIAQFQRTVELRPEFGDAHYGLGLAYAEAGQENEAIAAFQRCVNLNPRHAEARERLGTLAKQREERLYKEIVRPAREAPPAGVPPRSEAPAPPVETKVIREAVQRSPLPYVIAAVWGLWTAAYGLPLLCLLFVIIAMPNQVYQEMQRQGVVPASMQGTFLQLVLLISLIMYGLPTLVGILFVVGNVRRWPWVFYGNIVAAVLIMALEACSLAVLSGANQNVLGSQAMAGMVAVSLCTFLPPVALILLDIFARNDFRRQAAAVVPEEERLPAGDATDYYNRGLRRGKRGRLDLAVTDFEQAVRLRPGDATFRNVLALAYAEQKRFPQAIEQLQAALKIVPNDPATVENLRIVQDLQKKG